MCVCGGGGSELVVCLGAIAVVACHWQVLDIEGENVGGATNRNVKPLLITSEQFEVSGNQCVRECVRVCVCVRVRVCVCACVRVCALCVGMVHDVGCGVRGVHECVQCRRLFVSPPPSSALPSPSASLRLWTGIHAAACARVRPGP